jgi:hypothetical protein
VERPVCDHEAREPAAPHVGFDERFRGRVERAGRLVEDEEGRRARKRPGDLQALALPAAQVARALVELRVEAAGARLDLLGERRVAQRRADRGIVQLRIPQREVVADRAFEKHDVLVHEGHGRGELVARPVGDRTSAEQDLSAPRMEEPGREARHRGLARAGSAYQRDALPGLDDQRELVEERRLAAVVAEGDAAEFQRLRRGGRGRFARLGAHARLGGVIEDVVEARQVAPQRLHLLRRREELLHRRSEAGQQHLERDEVAHREFALQDAKAADAEDREVRRDGDDARHLRQGERRALRLRERVHELHLQAQAI